MTRYAEHVSTRQTPQSEQADPAQAENNAGGFSFVLDMWGALDRWLILGSEGGTFYTREMKLTKERAKTLQACLDADASRTIRTIVETSQAGRAPKNDPAIFALAMAAAHVDPAVRREALAALPLVCRTGTHLFQFAQSVEAFRGWGRALRRAVGNWYTSKDAAKLAYQLAKYRQRGGWSHRDLLRLAHAKTDDKAVNGLLRWAVRASFDERKVTRTGQAEVVYPSVNATVLPRLIEGFARAQSCTDKHEAARLVREYNLSWEMLPSEMLPHAVVWEALLDRMPMTAMIRNLGRMTSMELVKPLSEAAKLVSERLLDETRLKKARVHPLSLLVALKTYESGKGMRGSLTWTPVAKVCDALNDAFYLSFESVVPSGKNTMLALDVSGSMDWQTIAGMPITPRVASAAMAMVTARTEPDYMVAAFASSASAGEPNWGRGRSGHLDGITALPITPQMRLDDVVNRVSNLPFGGTDCSLPMRFALENKILVDTFVVYTDNETWVGNIHPHQALQRYRQATGRNAKLIVVGMTATDFTIADPSDSGMLDVVGFNTAAPRVMADFARE